MFESSTKPKTLQTDAKSTSSHRSDFISTMRIDEGTFLLLENLPASPPHSVLDMGCGYGALGLPIAAKYPNAQFELVDRDLLAVDWSKKNAEKNKLTNVQAIGSLGFRDLPEKKYDWVLCNVPARIGTPFIKNLIEESCARLTTGGDFRIVVIRDLAPVIETLSKEMAYACLEIARGPRHVIFSFPPHLREEKDEVDLYYRDTIPLQGIELDRPHDLGGDDPKRLAHGLPLLMDTLPRQNKPERILIFRAGYGAMVAVCLARWPEAHITAMDRDLLATTFTRRNVPRDSVEILEATYLQQLLEQGEKFDLILGELSPSAGEKVALAEIEVITQCLKPKGQALILAMDKLVKDWIKPAIEKTKLPIQINLSREGYSVLRIGK